MGSIRASVGLASGINTGELVNSLIRLQRSPVIRLENRVGELQITNTALKTLEANLLTLSTSAQTLGDVSSFSAYNVSNSDTSQLSVTTDDTVLPGIYQFQSVRLATTHQALGKGYANSDQQSIGAGTLTIANGGHLTQPTPLDVLNSGTGVRRGTIRITDRGGRTADLDLSNAYSVDDVLQTINQSSDITVSATTLDGKIILTDTSGATAQNFSVIDLSGGHAAEDLGITQSVAANTLTGTDILQVTGDFTLAQINDGNGVRRLNGAPDIKITTTDDTEIEINLDDAVSINDVVLAINNHEDNTGKVLASFTNGHLELSDTSGGGGSSSFVIEDINDTNVVRQLGLEAAPAGGTITGRRLIAGINSVLLANLRGGQGIDQTGSITVTDRTGETATLDLSTAESLDEVIAAINSAETVGAVKLQLSAKINDTGTGIEITDTSSDTASNLVIADVGGSTLADQLGIAIDAAQTSVDSGSLNHRYVSHSTSLDEYSPDGKPLDTGTLRITDSAGNEAVVIISAAVKTVGDVIQRINSAADIQVTAELNETGDGFVLIDEAGGGGTLAVEEVGGTTAADLRLLGESVVGSDSKQRVTSRLTTVIEVEAGETLDDLVQKINDSSGYVNASVFNDGSAFNSQRLRLTAENSGFNGRLVFDDNGLNLGVSTSVEGQDALLRIGGGTSSGFLVSSETNTFEEAATGIDVNLNEAGSTPAEVVVSQDDAPIEQALKSFVDGYNTFVNASKELTKFDPESNTRGPLQGVGVVLRVQNRLVNLASRSFTSGSTFDTLFDLGIRSKADGTLVFDKDRLASAITQDRQAVSDLLLTEETGFAAIVKSTVESLTDPLTGTFALEDNALQTSIKSLTDRISQLDSILATRQDRLLREFANMESVLSSLQSQQLAIGGIRPLSIAPLGTGVF
jgi:flagellar hook-associated protein 2